MSTPTALDEKLWNYPPSQCYGGTGYNILPPSLRYGATGRD